jgi:ABC-type bacteriocin/lantibiotic exporter with double-glycine peptidase domain
MLLFIIINFIISAFSDIILNFLSKSSIAKNNNLKIIMSLKTYFKNKSIIQSAIYAGITIVIALLIVMIISKSIFNFYVPKNNNDLLKFIVIAFPLGYVADVFIDKFNIFGNELDLYYKVAGAGLWGALAFVFSIIISYLISMKF